MTVEASYLEGNGLSSTKPGKARQVPVIPALAQLVGRASHVDDAVFAERDGFANEAPCPVRFLYMDNVCDIWTLLLNKDTIVPMKLSTTKRDYE